MKTNKVLSISVAMFAVALIAYYCAYSQYDTTDDNFLLSDSLVQIDDSLPADTAMMDEISLYHDSIDAKMSEVLCQCDTEMVARRPESGLMRLVADINLYGAKKFAHHHHLPSPTISFCNAGGIRSSLPKGNITLGDIFQLSPFNNKVVIVELDSASLQATLDHIAERGGEAVSGMTFTIDEGKATNVLINNAPITNNHPYFLATLDYLAEGGDAFFSLVNHPRFDTDIVFHDALSDYLRQLNKQGHHLTEPQDQRISTNSSSN